MIEPLGAIVLRDTQTARILAPSMVETPRTVGALLRRIRTHELKLTQEQFGRLFGTTQTQVSDWERGRLQPNRDNIKKIVRVLKAKGLQVTTDDFMALIKSRDQSRHGRMSKETGMNTVEGQHVGSQTETGALAKLQNENAQLKRRIATAEGFIGEFGEAARKLYARRKN